MGLFGAMFAVATVIGPLIGGLCVTYLSWRWVFYINLPLGILALFVTGAVLPGHLRRVHHTIDYAGTLLLAGSATSLIIFASLGGISWPWVSAPSIATAVLGVVLAVGFLFVERVAAEPVIPLRLFRVRVFNAASAIGFVMGFAMFGALTFLPLFLQNVKGVSPTVSGLRHLAADARDARGVGDLGPAGDALGALQDLPDPRLGADDAGRLPAVLHRRVDEQLGARLLHVRLRRRHGPDHAGARGGGAERRVLRAAGRGDELGHVLPHDRRLVRHGGVRCDLRHRLQPDHRADPGQGAAGAAQGRSTRRRSTRRCWTKLKSTAEGLVLLRQVHRRRHARGADRLPRRGADLPSSRSC